VVGVSTTTITRNRKENRSNLQDAICQIEECLEEGFIVYQVKVDDDVLVLLKVNNVCPYPKMSDSRDTRQKQGVGIREAMMYCPYQSRSAKIAHLCRVRGNAAYHCCGASRSVDEEAMRRIIAAGFADIAHLSGGRLMVTAEFGNHPYLKTGDWNKKKIVIV